MKRETKGALMPLKVTVALAMLAAISIILGKFLQIPGGEVLRFSFENLPIIFAGTVFGPVAGILVGVVADLVGCVMVGYTINPIVTVGAAVIGGVSGICSLLLRRAARLPLAVKVGITVFLSHIIGSVVVKTFGLSQYYDMPFMILMLWRLLNYAIVGALEGGLLYILLRNKMIRGVLASFIGHTPEVKK